MRINRLRVAGFRSIATLDIELPQVCALVGANNTGKSNILDVVNRVLGTGWVSRTSFNEDDVTWRDPDGDIEVEVELDPAPTHRPFKGSTPVDVPVLGFKWTRYKIGAQKGERRLEQYAKTRQRTPIQVPQSAPRKGVRPTFAPLTSIPGDVREQIPVIHIGADRRLSNQLPSARYSLLRLLLDDVRNDFYDPLNTVDVVQDGETQTVRRSEHFAHILDQAMSLLRTDAFTEIETSIKRNALRQLGMVDASDSLDFHFAPLTATDFYRALDLVVREHGFDMSATQLGHGIQNALVLAILQVFEQRRKQGAVFLIEEPEMFLHPQMQRALYRTIRSLGQSNQVIYTTHSPHFVSVPEYDEVVRVARDVSGTAVRRSTLVKTPPLEEKARKELDPERNELFFASRVLLVEGDTEKLALPEYARRLDIDLDVAGTSIIEVGGKRNLPAFLDIAESFGIPTGVVYDRDASDFKGQRTDEAAFNAALDLRQDGPGQVKVWQLAKDFEDHLRAANGEAGYQSLCQRYPGVSKAVRARLIAADQESVIPPPIPEVLTWLAGLPAI